MKIDIVTAFTGLQEALEDKKFFQQKLEVLEQDIARIEAGSRTAKVKIDAERKKKLQSLQLRIEQLQDRVLFQVSNIGKIASQFDPPVSTTSPPRLLSLPWSDRRWTPSENDLNSYHPQISGLAPGVLRVGEIQQIQNREPLELKQRVAALVPIRALSSNPGERMPGHIAIFSDDANSRQAAVAAIQSIALRIISTFPMRKLKGVFIDPVSMGNNFPFKNMPDFISGLKTYTRSDDVREQLRTLTVHIEQVIQNYLNINYQSLEDYNAAKSSVEEPYRYLFIADFPTNFDKNSWEDLKSLLVNGARAGVYAVVHIDKSLEKPFRDINDKVFDNYCTVLRSFETSKLGENLFNLELNKDLTCNIILDRPPDPERFTQLTEAINKGFKEVKNETVPFTEFYPKKTAADPEEWSEAYDSRQEIRAPIGVMGAMDMLEFWMGSNEDGLIASQALLAGKPGAGKSYTLHAIIISLALRYSPDELEMYMLDFKEGVEFQIYVDPERSELVSLHEDLNEEKALPHAKVISIESDREFGLSVLQSVQEEIEKRGSQFKSVGVSSLTEYRTKRPHDKMPRILVVIDEFQYMFQERDKITDRLNLIFEDITRRGRAFGVHLLIASQSPNVPNMSRGIYSFIELRMAQQMDKSTAASVLAEGNIDAVDLLERPGKVIYNKDFGRKGHNAIGQVADVSLSERIQALLHVQAIATQRNYQRPEPLILFNGTRATKVSHNRQLAQLSMMPRWLSLQELNKQVMKEPDWLVEETPGVAWLGEAMRIGNHTKAIFRRRSRSNLLLVGTSEETIFGMLGGILLSLVHSYEAQKAQFIIIDMSQSNEDNYWSHLSTTFRDAVGRYFPTLVAKRFPNPEQQVVRGEELLQKTYEEFERRQKKRVENPDEINLGQSLFFLYALGSINRAQNLRSVAGRRGEEPSEDAQKLIALVAKGAELGIHTILWVDSMRTFQELTGDNRSSLMSFDLRVGLNMPAEDSRTLLGEHYAQTLPRLMAYFCDRTTGSELEKFKPYAVLSDREIFQYSKQFHQRSR